MERNSLQADKEEYEEQKNRMIFNECMCSPIMTKLHGHKKAQQCNSSSRNGPTVEEMD